ncbi:MAG TPA: hypothetical protein VF622_14895 [Segetibacter sp.]|jgi:hypothetical protein
MIKVNVEDYKLLAAWAADCAEHVLIFFEQNHKEDDRPRKAVEAAKAWADGKIKMTEARMFAFAAHTAAREAHSQQAKAAARSAGHAAATAHVASHAKHAASYALKASNNAEAEREWQLQRLLQHLRVLIEL